MLKRVIFAVVATAFVTVSALPVALTPAVAAAMTCKAAAKAKFPKGLKDRHAFKKHCKEAWKAHNKK